MQATSAPGLHKKRGRIIKVHMEAEATLHDGHDRAPAPLHLAQVASPLSRLVAACTATEQLSVQNVPAKGLCRADQPPSWVCSTTIMHHPCRTGTQCTDNSIRGQTRRTPNKRLFTSPVKPSELLASSEDACTKCQACRYDL